LVALQNEEISTTTESQQHKHTGNPSVVLSLELVEDFQAMIKELGRRLQLYNFNSSIEGFQPAIVPLRGIQMTLPQPLDSFSLSFVFLHLQPNYVR